MIGNWIYEENALPFFEVFANIVGYKFDTDDWNALKNGIKVSDLSTEPQKWFDYNFDKISFSVGQDHGTSVIELRIDAPKHYEQSINTVFDIMSYYRVSRETS
jgi:hypothetical protein